jgi:hypothetical protein
MPPTKWQASAGRPGNRAILTRCDCGTVKLARLYTVRSGRTLSCGCIKREQTLNWWADSDYVTAQRERGARIMAELWSDPAFAENVSKTMTQTNHELWADPEFAAKASDGAKRRMTKHGLAQRPLYGIHRGMLARCYVPTAKGYQNWGARGIGVYGPWHAIETGIPEMETILGPRPLGSTLDRVNNNGHYEPGNIRWATPKEQRGNTGRGLVTPIGGPPCNRRGGCPCRG